MTGQTLNLKRKRRVWVLLAVLLALILSWINWHKPINRAISIPLLLHSESPRQDWFFDLANQLADPTDFLQQCWNTGKVVHRQEVAAYIKEKAAVSASWLPKASGLLIEAARDGDLSVRELALGTMEILAHPDLIKCAQEQLSDPDPLVRLLGLEYIRKAEPHRGVPLIIPLLEDPDPRVVARAEIALARWTKLDFGARVRLAIPADGESARSDANTENLEKLRHAVERRKEWWQAHAQEFSTNSPPPATVQLATSSRPPLTDFTLSDLDGRRDRFSAFQGRTVLLNFWATWCPACLAEMPELVALQKKHGDRLAIIGVALDGVADEHGDTPGESHSEPGSPDTRTRVLRVVKARNLNYTVLLDPQFAVGARFNGGELPTTVIIDASGRVRRRFIGGRTSEVLESMISEVDQR